MVILFTVLTGAPSPLHCRMQNVIKREHTPMLGSGAQQSAPPRFESQPVSRVLSWIIIHLDWKSPSSLKQPTRKRRGQRLSLPIWSCSGWGLPCHSCYHERGALLPHPFTLTRRGIAERYQAWRFAFCCTGRRLAPPRRYLAPCPVEPGLSSSSKSVAGSEPAIIQLTARVYPMRAHQVDHFPALLENFCLRAPKRMNLRRRTNSGGTIAGATA